MSRAMSDSRDAISKLIITYAERVDLGDFEGVGSLFESSTYRSAVGDDRRLQIVASLLTLRPVTLRELATQSGLEPADCVGVLHQLTALGLLRITDPRPTPARTGRRRSESARPQETPEPVGVMARLRGRLGLRGSR